MSSPQDIPEKNLAASPENDDIQNVRPGKTGKYIEEAAKQPTITVTLVADEKDAPVPIGVIQMTSDTPAFQVLYQPSDEEDFKPVTEQGSEEPKVRIAVLQCEEASRCPKGHNHTACEEIKRVQIHFSSLGL